MGMQFSVPSFDSHSVNDSWPYRGKSLSYTLIPHCLDLVPKALTRNTKNMEKDVD